MAEIYESAVGNKNPSNFLAQNQSVGIRNY
jgi:hypothetical protein